MLRIRLKRTGNRNNPTFRLVVAEKGRSAKGKTVEILGHFLPTRDPVVFEFDKDRVEHWLKQGAAPSDTVARMLTTAGIKDLEKYIERYTKKKKRKEAEEEPAEAPPASAEGEEPPAGGEKEEKAQEEEKVEEAPAEEKQEEEKPEEPPAEEKAEDAPEASDDGGDDKKEEDS